MSFSPSDAPAPAPAASTDIIIPRTLGSLQLNDRVQTFFDRDDIPGVNKIEAQPRVRFQGEQVPVLVDKMPLNILIYLKFKELMDTDTVPGGYVRHTYQDWQDLLEQQLGVAYNRGDRIYNPVWVSEPKANRIALIGVHPTRSVRWLQVSFKLVSQFTTHA